MRQGPAIHPRQRRGARRPSQSSRPRAGGRLEPSRRVVRAGGRPVQVERQRPGRDRARHRGVAAATVRARAVGPRRPRGRVARPAAAGAPGIGTGARRRARTIAHQRPFRLAGAGGAGRMRRARSPWRSPALYGALAQQCFINEYVFACTDGRSPAGSGACASGSMPRLRSDASVPPLWPIAVGRLCPAPFACRAPICCRAKRWPDPIPALLDQQVHEPTQERQIRASIPALTAIDDDVSLKVRRPVRGHALSALGQGRAGRQAGGHRLVLAQPVSRRAVAEPGPTRHPRRADRRLRHRPARDRNRAAVRGRQAPGHRSEPDQPRLRRAQDARARLAQHRICAGRHPRAWLARPRAST